MDLKKLRNILFLDIETVPQYQNYENLSDRMQLLWNKKAAYIKGIEDPSEAYNERAGIFAEFGKVISIGLGRVVKEEDRARFVVHGITGHDEKEVLARFIRFLDAEFSGIDPILCAHNGKEFDFPYLCRRILVNGMKLPDVLDISGKKPWEVHHIDTMELWKFGDYKHFTSLDLLAAILDVPTSKDDIDGSQVRNVYYNDQDLDRIEAYCLKDVVTLGRVYLKLKGSRSFKDEHILVRSRKKEIESGMS